MASAVDEGPPPKTMAIIDAAASKKRTIDNLPNKILEVLIRSVPQSYDSYYSMEAASGPHDNGASVANARVLTQFHLRLCSRKWAASVYRQFAAVGLAYEAQGICIFQDRGDYQDVALCNRRRGRLGSRLDKLTDEAVAGIAEHSLASLITKLNIRIEHEASRNESLADVLGKISSMLAINKQQSTSTAKPCSLNLTLAINVKSRIDDLNMPLRQRFPLIELRSLCLDLGYIPRVASGNAQLPRHVIVACDSLKFLFTAGVKTLVELTVNVFLLKRVFCDGDQALPATWACDSLRKLHLKCLPLPYDANYVYPNEQGMLPRIFPRLQALYFYGSYPYKPQIDFSALAQLPRLTKLGLRTNGIQSSIHVTPLPSVRELSLMYPLPFEISALVPNLEKLEILASLENAFSQLAAEIAAGTAGGAALQYVSELTLSAIYVLRPSFDDLVRLLQALQSLPKLAALTVSTSGKAGSWARAGDLALLGALPEGLSSLCFEFVLVPNDCACQTRAEKWVLDAAPQEAELSFKTFIRNLLHRVSGIPALAKFRCVCVAPCFEAIVGLASRWNRSVAFAKADLGLSCVVHVQCTENYQRMRCPGQPLREGDQMDFRFIVSPQAQFDPHSLKPLSVAATLKRKIINVVFENPNYSNQALS